MPRFMAPLSLLVFLVLAGCATLTKEECQSADWYQIGVTDGAEGYGAERLQSHRRACAKVGVSPDAEQWLAGRERGLRLYCTSSKAFEEGQNGRTIRGGCTPSETRAMMPAWEWGRMWWQLQQEIISINSEITTIDDDITALPADDTVGLGRLTAEQMHLRNRLRLLYLRQHRYESYP